MYAEKGDEQKIAYIKCSMWLKFIKIIYNVSC